MNHVDYRAGIDLGGTAIKAGLVRVPAAGPPALVASLSCPTAPERPWQQVVADMDGLIRRLLIEQNLDAGRLSGIGASCPGLIDAAGGRVLCAYNLGWFEIPLAAELGRYYDLPVHLGNDGDCAALGELRAGAGQGLRHLLLLTLGTGLGGGVIIDGSLFQGGSAGAMEVGHTLLVMDGQPCSCGRLGCLEAYTSATALIRQAREAAATAPHSLMHQLCRGDLSHMDGAIPFAAAHQGDATAQGVLAQYIRYLGEGIINFINLWRPQKILLGGGLSLAGSALLDPLNAYVRLRCFAGAQGFVAPIEQATLGNTAGMIGAAFL